MNDLQRVGVKLFCERGADIPLVDFIPVFHRWIQTAAVPGRLIDVADYSHVPEGPGVILVSHEGIYSVDEAGGRRGLAYMARRAPGNGLDERLAWALRAAFSACRLLEKELAGLMTFRCDEIEIVANDRLQAANTAATLSAWTPHLNAAAARLFPGASCALRREEDERERFAVRITAPSRVSFSEVASRVLA